MWLEAVHKVYMFVQYECRNAGKKLTPGPVPLETPGPARGSPATLPIIWAICNDNVEAAQYNKSKYEGYQFNKILWLN